MSYHSQWCVLDHNRNDVKEWVTLGCRDLTPSTIYYEPQINSRTVQGERARAGARREGEIAEGGTSIDGEAQGGGENGWKISRAAELKRRPGHVAVPEESRAYVSVHGVWKGGATVIFDIRILNLDVGSYLCMTPEKSLAKAEKDKKDL